MGRLPGGDTFDSITGKGILANVAGCRNPQRPSTPKAWALIDFESPTSPHEVEARIRRTFDAMSLGSPT